MVSRIFSPCPDIVSDNEIPAIIWLSKTLGKPQDDGSVLEILKRIRQGETLYEEGFVLKRNGKLRKILKPVPELKKIQREINRRVLSDLIVHPNVSGFSGGQLHDAIRPHLNAKSIFCTDIKDAFPSVTYNDVFRCLTKGREYELTYDISDSYYVYDEEWDDFFPCIIGRKRFKILNHGFLSWYAAQIVTEIATAKDAYGRLRLAQGFPTSPRLFDAQMEPIDIKLTHLAQNVEGVYTRFADNIHFSMQAEEFPGEVARAILKTIEGRGRNLWSNKYECHKTRSFKTDGQAVRILGLNIIDGKIHNTRAFKRAVRLSIHHVKWFLERGIIDTEEFEHAYRKLNGQMGFAVPETFPVKLLDDYSQIKKTYKDL